MTWIVFWIATSIQFTPCPMQGSTVDDYGIAYSSMVQTSVACFKTEKKEMSKKFSSLQEAELFVKNAPKCEDYLLTNGCAEGFRMEKLP